MSKIENNLDLLKLKLEFKILELQNFSNFQENKIINFSQKQKLISEIYEINFLIKIFKEKK